MASFADFLLPAWVGSTPLLLQQQGGFDLGGLGPGELGVVGFSIALCLWALREANSRRLDEAQRFAATIKEIQDQRVIEAKQQHEQQMALVIRLLDARERDE